MGARSGGVSPNGDRPVVEVLGQRVVARRPEGREATTTVAALVERLRERGMSTEGVALPRGVVYALSEGRVTAWVHEIPHRVHPLQWIAPDSPARYGKGTTYRNVRLALPHLITVALFVQDRRGTWTISSHNEAFFSVRPIASPDDPLLYPALLNCSRFDPQEGRPLSWICSTSLNRSGLKGLKDPNARMREGLRTLLHCLLESGFNYSSERHEASSWFTDSTRVDRRVSTVERWQEESLRNPRFVFEVPWIPTGHSVDDVARRAISLVNRAMEEGEREEATPGVASDLDLSREVFALAGVSEGPAEPAGGSPPGGSLTGDLSLDLFLEAEGLEDALGGGP